MSDLFNHLIDSAFDFELLTISSNEEKVPFDYKFDSDYSIKNPGSVIFHTVLECPKMSIPLSIISKSAISYILDTRTSLSEDAKKSIIECHSGWINNNHDISFIEDNYAMLIYLHLKCVDLEKLTPKTLEL